MILVDLFVATGYPASAFCFIRWRQYRRQALERNRQAFEEWRRPPHESILFGDICGALLSVTGPIIATLFLLTT